MVLGAWGRNPSELSPDLVDLRELDASDCDVLDEVFAGMSPESRFLRYLTPMPALPAQARRILLALDCCSHVAVAAFADGQAIGLARLVGHDERRAELAVEVVDAWQGQGVGTRLGLWVRERAASLGYTELVAETSAGNSRAQAMIRTIFPDYTARREGTVLVFTMPVGSIRPSAA
jgi:GNAT superfamily N-acetyltransferase